MKAAIRIFTFNLSIATFAANAADRQIEVQGHRGARAARPENTIAAFEYALQAGVDTLELDIAVTKDLVPVVSHDPLLNPSLCLDQKKLPVDAKASIYSMTFAEIKTLDCGTLKHAKFEHQQPVPGERMPSLDEVFTFVKSSPIASAKLVRFNIETKLVPRYFQLTPSPEAFVDAILQVVQKHRMEERVSIQSFDHRTLKEVKRKQPKIVTVALVTGSLHSPVELVRSLGAEVYAPHLDWINQAEVDALHRAGKRVIPWTANSREEWEYLVGIGVDGIISDDPAALIQFLREKKLR